MKSKTPKYTMGIEGSANKIGIGIIDSSHKIIANPRKTFITPPGTGFLPKETADHHRSQVLKLIQEALSIAKITMKDIELICYTKGPGMGGPLSVGATVGRTLSIMYNIDIVGVNHCVAHIEMGRHATGMKNPVGNKVYALLMYSVICVRGQFSGDSICGWEVLYIWGNH